MSEQVPEGWDSVRVRDIFSLNTHSVVPNNFPNEKFTYFSLPAFDEFGTSIVVNGDEIESNKFLIEAESLLVSKLNPRKPRVMFAKPNNHRACASTEFISYVVNNPRDVSLDFFYFYFFGDAFHRRLQTVATGSTNSHVRVTPTETLDWEVPFPPLPEQKKIASILTSVDEVIEKTQSQIDKLQDLKKGTMNELLTKGIGHTEFKESELGRIPKSWEVIPVEEYVSVGRGYAFKSSDFKTEGHPIIRVTNISRKNDLDLSSDLFCLAPEREIEFANFLLKDNDFLLVMVGATVGKYAKVETKGSKLFLNQNMWRLRTKVTSRHSQSFAIYALQLVVMRFLNTMQGSARDFLTQKEFGKAMVAIPSIEEQEKIQKTLSLIDDNLAKRLTKLHQTQSLKKSLMQDLLTGKVRVSVN